MIRNWPELVKDVNVTTEGKVGRLLNPWELKETTRATLRARLHPGVEDGELRTCQCGLGLGVTAGR